MTELMRKLLDQYNDQNGTVKPAFTEEYDYKMTEAEFDKVFAALKSGEKSN